ncbi:MAG: hypothetical protein ACW967_01790 [Candidatus Hodarchaeales archaeon]|jgi:hypothetical protein
MFTSKELSYSDTTNTDKKSICISRSAWQALQEFKLVLIGNRSYSDSIISIRNQLGKSEDEFEKILNQVPPIPSYLLEKASLSRNSRRNGRSKTVVLSNYAWQILSSVKSSKQCRSYSEAILYLYHVFNEIYITNQTSNTLTNSILSEFSSTGSK